jgi:hypothetical protein
VNYRTLISGCFVYTAIMPYKIFNATLALKITVDWAYFLDEMGEVLIAFIRLNNAV